VLALDGQSVAPPPEAALVAVVGTGDDHADRLRVASELRAAGVRVRPDTSDRKLGKQLEAAAKAGAQWAVIIGEELSRGEVVVRDLESGDQRTLSVEEAVTALSA
jgi:histidyl-tRNA synthetase